VFLLAEQEREHEKKRQYTSFLTIRKRGNLRRKLLPLLIADVLTSRSLGESGRPQVVNGQVSISIRVSFCRLQIPCAIINWKDFSIKCWGNHTLHSAERFQQRIESHCGQNPSQILGALQSNGQVFLINPNGILFGQGSQVNVNGLVVSTLNLKNEDFLAGKLNFNATIKRATYRIKEPLLHQSTDRCT